MEMLNLSESGDSSGAANWLASQEALENAKADLSAEEDHRQRVETERDNALLELDKTRDLLDRLASAVGDLVNSGLTVNHLTEVSDALASAKAAKLLRNRA